MSLFYKLTTGEASQLIAAELPRSSWKLWTWITTLNPFGDRQIRITWEIAKEAIGISKTTFYRALAQLTNAGLLISQRGFGFWISPKNGNRVPEMEIDSQKCVSESQKQNSSLYTDLKTFSYCPDSQSEEKCKIPNPESNTNDQDSLRKPKTPEKLTTVEVNQNSTVKPVSQGEEKSSAARRTKKRTKKPQGFDWLPDGPWNIDGKLDPNFRDWLAKNWVKRYGGDFHDKQADVLAHFRKDPANLAIRWEQYQNEFVHRVENTQMRLANGCQINEATQQTLITHQRAVTAVLPPEMNPVAAVAPVVGPVLAPAVEKIEQVTRGVESVEPVANTRSELLELSPSKNSDCEPSPWDNDAPTEEPQEITRGVEPVTDLSPSKNSEQPKSAPKTDGEEYTTLADGTRLKIFKRKEKPEFEPVSPEQAKSLGDMVQSFLQGFGGERKAPAPKSLSELEELNQWLHNPALREEAINHANRSPDYKYCPDSDQIISAEEF
jgi:hypothetical protein